jgi:hypothetical protein
MAPPAGLIENRARNVHQSVRCTRAKLRFERTPAPIRAGSRGLATQSRFPPAPIGDGRFDSGPSSGGNLPCQGMRRLETISQREPVARVNHLPPPFDLEKSIGGGVVAHRDVAAFL